MLKIRYQLSGLENIQRARELNSRVRQLSGVSDVEFSFSEQRLYANVEDEACTVLIEKSLRQAGVSFSREWLMHTLLTVQGLEDELVEEKVRQVLQSIGEVRRVGVSRVTQQVDVVHSRSVSELQIALLLHDKGVNCFVERSEAVSRQDVREYSFLFSVFLLLVGAVLSLFAPDKAIYATYTLWASLALSSIYLASDVLQSLFVRFRFGFSMLPAIATAAAAIYGHWLEAALLSNTYLVTRFFQARVMSRMRARLQFLRSLVPVVARVGDRSEVRAIDAKEIRSGMALLVHVGERIATDGVLAQQSGFFENPFNADRLEEIKQGEPVYAGFRAARQDVMYSAATDFNDSVLSRMVTQSREAELSEISVLTHWLRALVVASVMVSIVGVSMLFAIEHPSGLLEVSWRETAISLLVIAGFGSVLLAFQAAFLLAYARMQKFGVLVKQHSLWRRLFALDHILFDKRGVLTKDQPEVNELISLSAMPVKQVLNLICSLAQYDHDVSMRAIVDHGQRQSASLTVLTDVKLLQGRGVVAQMPTQKLALGNYKLVRELGADSSEVQRKVGLWEREGANVMFLVADSKVMGMLTLVDPVRDGVADTVDGLHTLHVERLSLLSEDNEGVTRGFAFKMGFDRAYSELGEVEKKAVVVEVEDQKTWAALVSNDTELNAHAGMLKLVPNCLSRSRGLEEADVVVLGSDLTMLTQMVFLARNTYSRLRSLGMIFLFYKAALLVLVGLQFLSVWGVILAELVFGLMLTNAAFTPASKVWVTPAIRPKSSMRLRPPRKQRIFAPGLMR